AARAREGRRGGAPPQGRAAVGAHARRERGHARARAAGRGRAAAPLGPGEPRVRARRADRGPRPRDRRRRLRRARPRGRRTAARLLDRDGPAARGRAGGAAVSARAHASPLDAFHLPGLDPAEVSDWSVREYANGVSLRFPRLRPDQLAAVLRHLRERRARVLADRSAADIAAAIAAAAGRLARDDDARRRTALDALPAVTGYSPPMVRLVLDRMIEDWSEPSLLALLRSEFHDPGGLDGFRPHPAKQSGQRTRAFGPELAFHIFAGNVPGVAVTSIARSLLVKAATLGKTASGEPLLPALFAQTLADVDRRLGECLAVTYWPGGSEALEAAAFEAADTIVVYG